MALPNYHQEDRPNEIKRVDDLHHMVAPPLEESLGVIDGNLEGMKISASEPSKRLKVAASIPRASRGPGAAESQAAPVLVKNNPVSLAHVTVKLKAVNLVLKDRKRKPLRREPSRSSLNPYLKLMHVESKGSVKEVCKTETVPKCSNPEFGEVSFMLELQDEKCADAKVLVDVVVMNEVSNSADEEVGTARVELDTFQEEGVTLELPCGERRSAGDLIIESGKVEYMYRG